MAARGLERFDDAEKDYKSVIAVDPKHTVAHFNLGVLYQEYAEKLDEARAQFETVLRIEREDASVRKQASARIKAIQIQIENQKMMEEMLRKQKEQEAKAKAEEKTAGGT